MMVNFFFSMILLAVVLACNYSPPVNHMHSVIILSFALTDWFQMYAIIDIILIWRNTQGKEVLRRLYRAIRVFI